MERFLPRVVHNGGGQFTREKYALMPSVCNTTSFLIRPLGSHRSDPGI
jgi:hypothetical protein